jgi:hypothetical protein
MRMPMWSWVLGGFLTIGVVGAVCLNEEQRNSRREGCSTSAAVSVGPTAVPATMSVPVGGVSLPSAAYTFRSNRLTGYGSWLEVTMRPLGAVHDVLWPLRVFS